MSWLSKEKQTHLKYAWIISWKATASGIESFIPIVRGDGPLDDPIPTTCVLNSILPTLSALDMFDGLVLPILMAASDLLDGGLGMAILLPEVGVGICRLFALPKVADAGADKLISPISENISPRSAYLDDELLVTEGVGLCSGAYGCTEVVGVEAFDCSGLCCCDKLFKCWFCNCCRSELCCWKKFKPNKSLLGLLSLALLNCCDIDCDLFICNSFVSDVAPWRV